MDENNVSGRAVANKTGFTFSGIITRIISEREAQVQIVQVNQSSYLFQGLDSLNVYFSNLATRTVHDLKNQELDITISSLPQHRDEVVEGIFTTPSQAGAGISPDIESISRKHLELFMERLRQNLTPSDTGFHFQSRVTLLHGDDFVYGTAQVVVNMPHSGYVCLCECPQLMTIGAPMYFCTKRQRMSLDNEGVLIILGQSEPLGDYVLWITRHAANRGSVSRQHIS